MKRLAHSIADTLAEVAKSDHELWVLDGDLGDSYGLYDDQGHPKFDRFLQSGIAEQTLVGIAAGLAARQRRPWVFSFSAFLCHRAADQIRTCIAHPSLPVVLVGSHAGAASGPNGASHACLSDLGVLGAIGGIDLWAPADESDAALAVRDLTDAPRSAYIRTSREPAPALPLAPGVVRDNAAAGDVALLSTGYASQWARDVVERLEADGIALPWVHFARLSEPLVRAWLDARPGLRGAIVLEDHGPRGGFADMVRRMAPSRVRVRSLSWPEGWTGESGDILALRRQHGLDGATIARTVKEAVA
jgi:transketolase